MKPFNAPMPKLNWLSFLFHGRVKNFWTCVLEYITCQVQVELVAESKAESEAKKGALLASALALASFQSINEKLVSLIPKPQRSRIIQEWIF